MAIELKVSSALHIYIYKHVWLNNKDTFYLCNFIKILSSFLISVLVSGWNWWMDLPKLSRALSDLSEAIIGVACKCYLYFQNYFYCFFFLYICKASRTCSHSLSISVAIIVVFSTRIFRNFDSLMNLKI